MLFGRFAASVSLALLVCGFTVTVNAQVFQFQADIHGAETTVKDGLSGIEGDSELKQLDVSYYLGPVFAAGGPLRERAFLSRSAFVFGSVGESSFEQGDATDIRGIGVHLVSQTGTIFGAAYETQEGALGDIKVMSFSLGKYLGERSLAEFTWVSSEQSSDIKTYKGRYRQLYNGATQNTYLANEIGLEYIDNQRDTGYQVSLNSTYYFSEKLWFGGLLSYLDIGDINDSRIKVSGGFFLTDTLSVELGLLRASVGEVGNIETADVRIGARF